MSAVYIDVSDFDIMPRMRSYLTRAGYPSLLSNVSPDIMARARDIYRVGMECARPVALYADIRAGELPEPLIPDKLAGSGLFTMFLFSLGRGFDMQVSEFFAADEALSAVLLDAWGSEAVEALAESVDRRFRELRGEGSIRFAPGYGDFDIRKNAEWLDILREQTDVCIPVSADPDTGILSPVKSILCMIGWRAGADAARPLAG